MINKVKGLCLAFLFGGLIAQMPAQGQTKKIDLGNPALWQVYGREQPAMSKDSIVFRAEDPDGLLLLKNETVGDAIIEFDLRGRNDMDRNFVGLAFNAQDEKHFELVYFRPFNFFNPDTVRRPRSVQYTYEPEFPWQKLRAAHPGKYENRLTPTPDPDRWFHVKLVIAHPSIKVYVNNNSTPCLTVESLSPFKSGKIGFHVGPRTNASFANLTITPTSNSSKASYGNNPAAGHYANAGDARLYYEVYGKGKPIVLLHGGVYGYIDEFEPFIDKLSKTNQVICIATRGHGKSEIGKTPFTWQQRAEDAYKVIRSITKDSVQVLGFSDGGGAGCKLAALHPELVTRLVAIGFGDQPKGSKKEPYLYSPELLMKQAKDLFEGRKALMPEPERWRECLDWLNKLYNDEGFSRETFSAIKCPVLVMSGDQDDYPAKVAAAAMIKNSRLSIIPACSHVVFYCNFPAVWESIKPFLAG